MFATSGSWDTKSTRRISKGYAWDGPSGPTIDTGNFMRGSLIHDALYQLMRTGNLPTSFRERADLLLRKTCIDDGMRRVGEVLYSMNSSERVIAALERREPDRLPTFEWRVSQPIVDAFAPGGDEGDFVEAAVKRFGRDRAVGPGTTRCAARRHRV
jgi:hypothetical protein